MKEEVMIQMDLFYRNKQYKQICMNFIYTKVKNKYKKRDYYDATIEKMLVALIDKKFEGVEDVQFYLLNYFKKTFLSILFDDKNRIFNIYAQEDYNSSVDIDEVFAGNQYFDYNIVYKMGRELNFDVAEQKVFDKIYLEGKQNNQVQLELRMKYNEFYGIKLRIDDKIRKNYTKFIIQEDVRLERNCKVDNSTKK